MLLSIPNTWRWIYSQVFVLLSKHKLAVLVTFPAELMGYIMKENINIGKKKKNTSTENKRQTREIEKKKTETVRLGN